jgi:hypothetical protein
MTRKNVFLVSVVVVAFALYARYFTDWFVTPRIRIICQNRIMPFRRRNARVYPVSFTLDGRYRLSSVQVISVSALSTNRQPLPLWHLVAKGRSAPTQGFFYGMGIRGMHPFTPRSRPDPLQPGTTYRLLVQAGRAKGEVDFRPRPMNPAGN